MISPLFDKAQRVLGLIKPNDKPETLLEHFDRLLPRIQEICGEDFLVWMGVLNVIQNWLLAGEPIFRDLMPVILHAERMTDETACMEIDYWPREKIARLKGSVVGDC